MGYKHYRFMLKDHVTGAAISATGGVCLVTATGSADKASLVDSTGTAVSNPVALSNGVCDFYTADTLGNVDLFIQAPGGHFLAPTNVGASGPNEFAIDTNNKFQLYKIPYSHADQTGDATETDTGFDEPASGMVLPNAAVLVNTIDASSTIDVGTDGSGSDDPDGFLDAAAIGVAGVIKGTLADGAATLGVLLSKDESSGDLVPEAHVCGGESITYTLKTGADTADGYILLPILLA